MIGEARDHLAVVRSFGLYDYDIDSTDDPNANAERIIMAWKARTAPSAFQRMYRLTEGTVP